MVWTCGLNILCCVFLSWNKRLCMWILYRLKSYILYCPYQNILVVTANYIIQYIVYPAKKEHWPAFVFRSTEMMVHWTDTSNRQQQFSTGDADKLAEDQWPDQGVRVNAPHLTHIDTRFRRENPKCLGCLGALPSIYKNKLHRIKHR